MAKGEQVRVLMSRRGFLQASAMVAASAALAACAPSLGSSSGGKTGSSGAGSQGGGAATGKVRSWTYSGQRWELAQKAVIPDFGKQHGNITVDLIATPIGETYPKIAAALAAGSDQYDIIELDYFLMPQVAGQLQPLDEYMSKDKPFADDYLAAVAKNVSDLYVWKNVRYGIANDSNTQLMFYRKDIFDKEGLKVPKTYNDVLELAKTLTRDTPAGKQYGFTTTGRRGVYSAGAFNSIYWSSGGEMWDEKTFQVSIDNDLAAECLGLLVELFKYADPSAINSTDDETIAAMSSGVAVLSPNSWGNNAFTNPQLNKLGSVTAAGVVPAGIGGKASPRPGMGGFGMVIPKGSKNKDAAWEFIKYVTSAGAMDAYIRGSGQPARLDALKKYASEAPLFGPLAESLPLAHWQPRLPETTQIYEAFGGEISSVLLRQKSVKDGLRDAQKGVEAIFRKAGYLK